LSLFDLFHIDTANRFLRDLAQEGSDDVGCWVCIADAQGNEWGRVSVGSDVD
jgi:hypothetical protein